MPQTFSLEASSCQQTFNICCKHQVESTEFLRCGAQSDLSQY